MKAVSFVLTVACGLFLTGCATVDFTPYVGEQREWPTRSGAFVKQVKGKSFYQSWPERPYLLLGHVTVAGNPNVINNQLAWAVSRYHADGVIIMSSDTFQAGTVNTASGSAFGSATSYGNTTYASAYGTTTGASVPILRNTTTGYLFRFQTNAPGLK